MTLTGSSLIALVDGDSLGTGVGDHGRIAKMCGGNIADPHVGRPIIVLTAADRDKFPRVVFIFGTREISVSPQVFDADVFDRAGPDEAPDFANG